MKFLILIVILFFLALFGCYLFDKRREGFWSYNLDASKIVNAQDLTNDSVYTKIRISNNSVGVYSALDDFANVCAMKIPDSGSYDTMVISKDSVSNTYSCYVTNYQPPDSTAPSNEESAEPSSEESTEPSSEDSVALFSKASVAPSSTSQISKLEAPSIPVTPQQRRSASCPDDYEKDKDGLCYPKCRDGYYGVGPVCWKRCDEGWINDGVTCRKPLETYGKGVGRAADMHGGGSQNKSCTGHATLSRLKTECSPISCSPVSCNWSGRCSGGCSGGDCRTWSEDYASDLCNSWSGCPYGWTDVVATCIEPISYTCRDDEYLKGVMCYPNCRDGYTDAGLICRKGGDVENKDSYGRGAGSLPS
jgi:hypothetical protein